MPRKLEDWLASCLDSYHFTENMHIETLVFHVYSSYDVYNDGNLGRGQSTCTLET